MKLRGILFDMDGTLGDTLPICVQALQGTLSVFTHRGYTQEEIYAMFGPSEEGLLYKRIPQPQWQPDLDDFLGRYRALHESASLSLYPRQVDIR